MKPRNNGNTNPYPGLGYPQAGEQNKGRIWPGVVAGMITLGACGAAVATYIKYQESEACQIEAESLLDYVDSELVSCVWEERGQFAIPPVAAASPEVVAPAEVAPAQQAAPAVGNNVARSLSGFPEINAPSGFDTGWYTDPNTNLTTMVIGGNLVFYQFDPQTKENYPSGERGGRCGENVYASGIAYLTGQVVSPITLWQQIEDNDVNGENGNAHSPTGSGEFRHRPLIASLYGLENHQFNSIHEAEQFARAANGNFYLIFSQNKTSGDSFSIHGSHIVGLIWDSQAEAWRSADPNDYYMQDAEPDLDDNLRFHTTDSLTNNYNLQGWTNPNGVPNTRPWQG